VVELKPSEAGYRNPGNSPGAAEHHPATGNPANPTEANIRWLGCTLFVIIDAFLVENTSRRYHQTPHRVSQCDFGPTFVDDYFARKLGTRAPDNPTVI
jgi:hypothetical protein